eukprot:113808_1
MAHDVHSGLMFKNFNKLLKTTLTPLNFEDSKLSWVEFPLVIRRLVMGYLSFHDLVRCRPVSKSFLAMFAYLVQRLERIDVKCGANAEHEYCALYGFVVSGRLRSLKHFQFLTGGVPASGPWKNKILATILTLYPTLQSFPCMDSRFILRLDNPLENMSKISISDLQFIGYHDELQKLASKLPSLSELQLGTDGRTYPHEAISDFVKSCSQLSKLSLKTYRNLPESVYMSFGDLQNLKTLTIASCFNPSNPSLSSQDFESVIDNFPPNLHHLDIDLDREYDMTVLRKFANHLENLASLRMYVNNTDKYGSLSSIRDEMVVPEGSGLQILRTEVSVANSEKLMNIFRNSPLTRLTHLLLSGFSKVEFPSSCGLLYKERFPVLPLCFPNVRFLYLDFLKHLERHVNFDHLEMMFLDYDIYWPIEDVPVCTDIAAKVMSLRKLRIVGDVLADLSKVCDRPTVSDLEVLAGDGGYAEIFSRMSNLTWPYLKRLKVHSEDVFNAKTGRVLKKIVASMPLLEKLVHVQHRCNNNPQQKQLNLREGTWVRLVGRINHFNG